MFNQKLYNKEKMASRTEKAEMKGLSLHWLLTDQSAVLSQSLTGLGLSLLGYQTLVHEC